VSEDPTRSRSGFDELARGLVNGSLSRRRALKLFAATALSSLVPARFAAATPEKVTICHKPGTPAEKTMDVPVSALRGHLGHGDTLGACGETTTTTTTEPPTSTTTTTEPPTSTTTTTEPPTSTTTTTDPQQRLLAIKEKLRADETPREQKVVLRERRKRLREKLFG
jgi:hypothetical protein